ncbi:MAG: hypothetical protein RR853_02070 [Aurantimicrobium sp.]|uniref:hypothetical protein n=1 Tax=Aurantimicrobium sp. TaxID=1930784 RepID=UPI002FCC8962
MTFAKIFLFTPQKKLSIAKQLTKLFAKRYLIRNQNTYYVSGDKLVSRFVYLLQGSSQRVLGLANLIPHNSKLITLTYDRDIPAEVVHWSTQLFAPGSTWAEGRNLLLSEALRETFDYCIFLDDDAEIVKGNFQLFQNLLLKHRPEIGLPLCDVIKHTHRYDSGLVIQRPVALDQIVQAYSYKTALEQIAIPFITDFDQIGWWVSCEINQFIILSQYSETTIQFNDFEIRNSNHGWVGGEADEVVSLYKAGEAKEVRKAARNYIVETFGPQQSIGNSLFHNPRKPLQKYGLKHLEAFSQICESFQERNYRKSLKICKNQALLLLNQMHVMVSNNRNIIKMKIR